MNYIILVTKVNFTTIEIMIGINRQVSMCVTTAWINVKKKDNLRSQILFLLMTAKRMIKAGVFSLTTLKYE